MIARHDIFRTSVAWRGLPEPVQVVWRQAELPVTEITLTAGDAADAGAEGAGDGGSGGSCWRRPGSRWISPGPRCCGSTPPPRREAGRWLGLVQVHHLLLDHTGLDVVLQEIRALLSGTPACCWPRCRSGRCGPGPPGCAAGGA